jgi:hypothetical protein
MSLQIRLAFFDDTGPGDGRLTAKLTKGALLDSAKSLYRGPATTSRGGSTPAPHWQRTRLREGGGVEISASKS